MSATDLRAPGSSAASGGEKKTFKRSPKKTEYGLQLAEKQKVRKLYGLGEAQLRRFFVLAKSSEEATGDALFVLLERRIDNVLFRAKMVQSRRQARQVVVHGHIFVNGRKVCSPSFLVSVGDVVTLASRLESKQVFLESVFEKRLQSNVKVPDWLELDSKNRKVSVLRLPVRSDIYVSIEDSLVVEFYSR